MLRINLSRQATKFLKRLPPKHDRQLAMKITALRDNPVPTDAIMLKGAASDYRRADIGEYRIIYRVVGDTLEVVVIGRRNDADVYKTLSRRI
jgi:mRNA interferase RelE/StbE